MALTESPFKAQLEQFIEESGVKESSAEILGPFSDIANRISEAVWLAAFPGSTGNSPRRPIQRADPLCRSGMFATMARGNACHALNLEAVAFRA